jgi:hypothetical protein
MATVNLSPLFNGVTNFDSLGNILAGGQLFTYQAGSSTPLATYTTVNGTIANANPIVLGSDGKIPNELWLLYGYAYKFVLQTASSVLVNTYDNISGIITSIPTAAPTLPTGVILIWSGSVGSIPSGYVICDGSNGTPDLRNSFVLGAGNSYTVGQTGGSADAIVVSHTHTATVTDPGHFHNINKYVGVTSSGLTSYVGDSNGTPPSNIGTGYASTGITVSNTTTGTSGTNANLPPYYALAYIMKS